MRTLGGDATALWLRGGPAGEAIRDLLDEESVPQEALPIEGEVRENLAVEESRTGQRFRLVLPGPEVSPSELERCLEAVAATEPPPDFLVLSGSLPPGMGTDVYARLARAAPDDCEVVVDTSGDALRAALDGPVDILMPNLRELSEITDREVEGDEEIESASRALLRDRDLRAVICTLGGGGVLLVDREGTERVRSPTVPIRSRVGAGDSSLAGFVVGRADGLSLREAVRLGVAAGAAAVMTPGTSLCRREDAERLHEQIRREV